MHTPTTAYLTIVAMGFLVTSYFGLLAPQRLTDYMGITLQSASAFNEIRGLYGGVHGMLGVLLLVCAFNPTMQRLGLLVCTAMLSGYVIGRSYSVMQDGLPNTALIIAVSVELVGALLALTLLSRGRQSIASYR